MDVVISMNKNFLKFMQDSISGHNLIMKILKKRVFIL